MERSWPQKFLQDRRTVWLIALIGLAVCLTTNLPWQIDDFDQAKQAFTSIEMMKEGHWIYQRTPHERVATKPPLVGWISAGTFFITRSWNIAWRGPSFLATAALAVILFRAAHRAYGPEVGLIALSAFVFNLLTPRLATLVRTDMPLALVIFAIGILTWEKIRTNQKWNSRDRVWMFALLMAGMLIKGPIIYAFLLPGIVLFQWWRRRKDVASAWCGWWPWIGSLAVFLAWAIVGIRTVPGFWDLVVMREFISRFGETVHRVQPIYFYLGHILHKFAPWSLLLIWFAVVAMRSPDGESAGAPSAGKFNRYWVRLAEMNPDTFWLVAWSLGGLVVMSLVPSKRVDRIFPVLPPLCLLLANQFRNLTWQRLRPGLVTWIAAALLLSLVFTVGYSGARIYAGYRYHSDAFVRFARTIREQCASRQWHYEMVESSDEGLLIYLQRMRFLDPSEAVEKWNSGDVDALIVRGDEASHYLNQLPNSVLALHSKPRRVERHGGSALLARTKLSE